MEKLRTHNKRWPRYIERASCWSYVSRTNYPRKMTYL